LSSTPSLVPAPAQFKSRRSDQPDDLCGTDFVPRQFHILHTQENMPFSSLFQWNGGMSFAISALSARWKSTSSTHRRGHVRRMVTSIRPRILRLHRQPRARA
jgi:hypothetical protein